MSEETHDQLTVADLAGLNTVSLREAADMLGYSHDWAYKLARRGEFPAKTIVQGRRYRVVAASLAKLLSAED